MLCRLARFDCHIGFARFGFHGLSTQFGSHGSVPKKSPLRFTRFGKRHARHMSSDDQARRGRAGRTVGWKGADGWTDGRAGISDVSVPHSVTATHEGGEGQPKGGTNPEAGGRWAGGRTARQPGQQRLPRPSGTGWPGQADGRADPADDRTGKPARATILNG